MRNRMLVMMLAAMMLVVTAAPAFAQGRAEMGPQHANSICSFSGLNDDPEEEPGRTQSYGQIVSTLIKDGVNVNAGPGRAAPGIECNGHLNPYPEAFPPPAP